MRLSVASLQKTPGIFHSFLLCISVFLFHSSVLIIVMQVRFHKWNLESAEQAFPYHKNLVASQLWHTAAWVLTPPAASLRAFECVLLLTSETKLGCCYWHFTKIKTESPVSHSRRGAKPHVTKGWTCFCEPDHYLESTEAERKQALLSKVGSSLGPHL